MLGVVAVVLENRIRRVCHDDGHVVEGRLGKVADYARGLLPALTAQQDVSRVQPAREHGLALVSNDASR